MIEDECDLKLYLPLHFKDYLIETARRPKFLGHFIYTKRTARPKIVPILLARFFNVRECVESISFPAQNLYISSIRVYRQIVTGHRDEESQWETRHPCGPDGTPHGQFCSAHVGTPSYRRVSALSQRVRGIFILRASRKEERRPVVSSTCRSTKYLPF